MTVAEMRPFLEIVNEIVMSVHMQNRPVDLGKEFVEAARRRFEDIADPADACEAVREIVANLIGCEQMVIFESDLTRGLIRRRWTFGVDVPETVDLLAHPEFRNVSSGEIAIFSEPIQINCFREPVTAIVPIPASQTPAGVLLLFRMLPQKEELTRTDRELLRVIAAGATAAIRAEGTERAVQQ